MANGLLNAGRKQRQAGLLGAGGIGGAPTDPVRAHAAHSILGQQGLDVLGDGGLMGLPPWAGPGQVHGSPLQGHINKMLKHYPQGMWGTGPELTTQDVLGTAFPHWSDADLQAAVTGQAPQPGGGAGGASPAGNVLPNQRSAQGPGSPGIPPISEGKFPNPPFEPFPTKIPVGQRAQGAQPGSGPIMPFSTSTRGMTFNEGRDLATDQLQEAMAWLRDRLKTVERNR